LKVSEYVGLMRKSLKLKKKILAVGKPGVGKTYGAREAAQVEGFDFISLCCPLQSPVKIGGYPRPPEHPDGDATHCLFDGISRAFHATSPTLLFWDDLGMAGGETLKAIVEMIQFGRIDGRVLPDCVVQCGATNDIGHGADVQGLIEPLKTRWHSIIPVETSVDDVVRYGLANGWPAWECAYLRNSPQAVHDWKPSKSMSIDGATPRGWEYLAGWDNDGIDDVEVWSGCVGKGRAIEAHAFKELQSELPDRDAVLASPMSAPVPENPGARYLVAMALAAAMNHKNFGACIQYLQRLPEMFLAFSVRDAFEAEERRREAKKLPSGYQPISASRDFSAWVVSKAGQDILGAMS
jgi:hypothetical protein